MVFSSTIFIFLFLPITLLGYYLLKGESRNYWLLFVSVLFFCWNQPNYLWIIVLNIIINYLGAMFIADATKYRKIILIVTICINLSLLFYFKYFDFTISAINMFLNTEISIRKIILPIGISFFTFQGMSYVIDVYRKEVKPQKNIFKVGLYIVLFPQLIAGPIVRYKDVAAEIENRNTTLEEFSGGIERFIIGLTKKAVIANTMAVTADTVWNTGVTNNTWIVAWIGSIAYTLQIYFDFSGYSDMAIGLGRMFGFHFNENFKLPYISKSISEFWRRWHISLSSWFRDYIYIPMGGNRKHVYRNLFIVFLLTGVWHGDAWNFIFWGIWNGCFIVMERMWNTKKRRNRTAEKKFIFKTMISKIYTLLVINLGWVIFRAPSLSEGFEYIATMLGMTEPGWVGFTAFWYLDKWTITIMILGILFASSLPSKLIIIMKKHLPRKIVISGKYVLLLGMLYLSMLRIVSGTYNPFIYFQF